MIERRKHGPGRLPCPHCGCVYSKVIDSRPLPESRTYYRRRRVCTDCGYRYTTHETIVAESCIDYQI